MTTFAKDKIVAVLAEHYKERPILLQSFMDEAAVLIEVLNRHRAGGFADTERAEV